MPDASEERFQTLIHVQGAVQYFLDWLYRVQNGSSISFCCYGVKPTFIVNQYASQHGGVSICFFVTCIFVSVLHRLPAILEWWISWTKSVHQILPKTQQNRYRNIWKTKTSVWGLCYVKPSVIDVLKMMECLLMMTSILDNHFWAQRLKKLKKFDRPFTKINIIPLTTSMILLG